MLTQRMKNRQIIRSSDGGENETNNVQATEINNNLNIHMFEQFNYLIMQIVEPFLMTYRAVISSSTTAKVLPVN
ncbi:CLUMA_CG021102, isoform A [Clunio marinus]|uniref:CLUMA_CG021102, isoform A n=1 Tax=Clunio marinus TaxID=568069 RepID=A0A1J1J6A6_9DIPT|nr:CLUMA_CG021102, isoform A [Clunio marinus]